MLRQGLEESGVLRPVTGVTVGSAALVMLSSSCGVPHEPRAIASGVPASESRERGGEPMSELRGRRARRRFNGGSGSSAAWTTS